MSHVNARPVQCGKWARHSSFQEGTGSVRFVSVPDFSTIHRLGSVRTIICSGSTRFGPRFSDASWVGPVRFGSFRRLVLAGSRITRFGSVRPIRYGFLLFLSETLAGPLGIIFHPVALNCPLVTRCSTPG